MVAAAYVRTRRGVERLATRLPPWCRAGIGGLAVGLMATVVVMFVSPGMGVGILGGGHGAAQIAITGAEWLPEGGGAVQVLLLLALAKLVATSWSLGTGASAGVFGPSLAIGALVGGAFGRLVQLVLDNPAIDPGAFALVGMGTFYGGIAHAPLAALVIVCELCGSYDLLVPLMLAGGIAFVTLRRFTLYPSQRASQMDSAAHPKHALRALQTMTVGSVLVRDRPFLSFSPGTPMSQVMHDVGETNGQDSFPVLDDDEKLVGMITPDSLRVMGAERDIEPWTLAIDAMRSPVTATVDENRRDVAERILAAGLRVVPVVDDEGRILGFIDESEVAQTYIATTRERLEPSQEGD